MAEDTLVPSGATAVNGASVPRVRLSDLPTPPEIVAEAKRWCARYSWNQRDVEEELKMQYYFGDQEIYLLSTSDGPVVVAIPDRLRGTPGLRYLLFTPQERDHVVFTVPSRWNDTESQV